MGRPGHYQQPEQEDQYKAFSLRTSNPHWVAGWGEGFLIPSLGADDDDEEEAAVAAGVGAVIPLPVVLGEETFFLNWKRKLSSSSSVAEVTALSDLGVPKRVRG